jgi:hypothetical protein
MMSSSSFGFKPLILTPESVVENSADDDDDEVVSKCVPVARVVLRASDEEISLISDILC